MTVLHLSSRWPAGLDILLATDARTRINELCAPDARSVIEQPCAPTLHRGTPLDFAIRFQCEEAVRMLFDAGSLWNNFRLEDTSSPMCTRIIAEKLLARRHRLFQLAQEVLTAQDLASVCPDMRFADSCAKEIIKRLRNAGVPVPEELTVPHSYHGIYLHGALDVIHLPIFMETGFCDITHRGETGLIPVQVLELGLCEFRRGYNVDNTILAPEFIQLLKKWGCLDQTLADPKDWGINTSATGWHIFALCLPDEICFSLGCKLLHRVFQEHPADDCDCHCSSAGCLPFTTWLKAVLCSAVCACGHHDVGLDYESRGWEQFPEGMAPELLRFLTFEALEITHTCCFGAGMPVPGRSNPHRAAPTLVMYRGDVDDIHEEEEELIERLEALVTEFEKKLRGSNEDLRDFVWGYWKKRMGEECVPTENPDTEASACTEVVYEEKCKCIPLTVRTSLCSQFSRQAAHATPAPAPGRLQAGTRLLRRLRLRLRSKSVNRHCVDNGVRSNCILFILFDDIPLL